MEKIVHMLKFTWAYVRAVRGADIGKMSGLLRANSEMTVCGERIERQLNKEPRCVHTNTRIGFLWDYGDGTFFDICSHFGVVWLLLPFFVAYISRLEMRILSSAQNPYSGSDLSSRVLLQLHTHSRCCLQIHEIRHFLSLMPCWLVTTSRAHSVRLSSSILCSFVFRLSSHFSSNANFNFILAENFGDESNGNAFNEKAIRAKETQRTSTRTTTTLFRENCFLGKASNEFTNCLFILAENDPFAQELRVVFTIYSNAKIKCKLSRGRHSQSFALLWDFCVPEKWQ